MAYGVLPSGEFLPVVRKSVADELADLTESETLLRALQDSHCDQGDVGVGRLHKCTLSGFVSDHGPGLCAGAQLVRRAVGAAEAGRGNPVGRVLGIIIVRVIVQVELVVNVLPFFSHRYVSPNHVDVYIFGQCRAVGHIRP